MEVNELESSEQVVFVALVRHLVDIDGSVSESELYELIRIGTRIGKAEFTAALEATEPFFADRDRVLARLPDVTRAGARTRILSELDRIASGDGLHAGEAEFLALVRAGWAA